MQEVKVCSNAKKAPSLKLAVCFMGAGHIAIKQYFKGVFFALVEVLFIFFMIFVGGKAIVDFFTLGSMPAQIAVNPATGMEELIKGDHSIFMMIYGIASLIIVGVFVSLYIISVKDVAYCNDALLKGKNIKFGIKELFKLFDNKFYITMLAFPVLGALFFNILPLIFMVLIAFTNYSYPSNLPPSALVDWVGFQSFIKLFSMADMSATFVKILIWTVFWAITTTFFGFFGGLILALAIEKKGIKFKRFWRLIFLINFAVPKFVSLLVMRYFLYTFGPVNTLISSLGLPTINFLSDPIISKVVVILISIWCGIPANMLLFVGIVGNIPESLYEAAKLDGATRFKQFTSITLPYVLFMAVPMLVALFIANFNDFGVIYFLTNGGPSLQGMYFAGQTDLLINWLYNLTMNAKQYDIASAVGIIIFLISAAISLAVYALSPSYRNEEQFQ